MMIPGLPSLVIRFDIDALGGGAYGAAAWTVFFQAVEPDLLAGSRLYEGDSAATLGGGENVYCLGLQQSPATLARVRAALEGLASFSTVAARPPFREDAAVSSEPLVPCGRVNPFGEIEGDEAHWVRAGMKRARAAATSPEAPSPAAEVGARSEAPDQPTELAPEPSSPSAWEETVLVQVPCEACIGLGSWTCLRCHGEGSIGGLFGLGAQRCPDCGGTGMETCLQCGGTGSVERRVVRKVRSPQPTSRPKPRRRSTARSTVPGEDARVPVAPLAQLAAASLAPPRSESASEPAEEAAQVAPTDPFADVISGWLSDFGNLIKYSLLAFLVWGCWAAAPVGWFLLAAWVFLFNGSFLKVLHYSFAPLWYGLKLAVFPFLYLALAYEHRKRPEDASGIARARALRPLRVALLALSAFTLIVPGSLSGIWPDSPAFLLVAMAVYPVGAVLCGYASHRMGHAHWPLFVVASLLLGPLWTPLLLAVTPPAELEPAQGHEGDEEPESVSPAPALAPRATA